MGHPVCKIFFLHKLSFLNIFASISQKNLNFIPKNIDFDLKIEDFNLQSLNFDLNSVDFVLKSEDSDLKFYTLSKISDKVQTLMEMSRVQVRDEQGSGEG